MLERDIEKTCCQWAKQNGWLPFKFVSPAHRGVPDRLLIRDGQTVYVEFKAPNKKPTDLQLKVHEQMREHGATVYVIDDVDTFKGIFK